ncbi:hypothetical protein Rsub_02315 [Raphidocelis subcapitata]|uniref:Uncharacterized protein n=1 Tax=Raphidocelis subcapitata TaxID=307507 RepID=A0A2V0NXE6_9CHLO|nr:hypothetical protein Rsub_02315 [Raphidocelis subcapitata]|eukprot:GBF89597.1 hypothetical protein Rsub_02315 [Raphidocelis subcapitata]
MWSNTNKCSASLFVTVNGVAKQVCKTCSRAGMLCPEGTSYCCKNGKCAAKLEDCTCRYASECQRYTCCARTPGTNVGKCSAAMFNATNFQVCPNCLRAKENGVNCTSDSSCLTKQCCGSDGFCRTTLFSGTEQSCKDCNAAKNRGVLCPTTRPYCCPHGQCVAKVADCDISISLVKVSKYQAHHLYYLDALANLTAAADNNLWSGGDYLRPSLVAYYDFRKWVIAGTADESGLPLLCDRYDYSTGTFFRGLDFKTAAGPLAWASDVAAQLWFAECNAMPKCKADMAIDKVTLAKMKTWTKRAADKMISYLQIAPAGRNVLCPPRAYFGFFYQTFVRPPSPASTFQGLYNWPTALNPSMIKIKNAAGADEVMSALQMLQRSAELKYYIPEPLLAMEGLIELIIGHDHSLLPTLPNPILPLSTPAAAPAATDGAAPEAAPVALASADTAAPQAAAPVEAMDAGPVADASYAENGFVAGVANPELLKHSAGTTWVAGCADGDLLCAAKSLGLLGAKPAAAGAAPEGAVSKLAADGVQIMAGDRSCLTELRAQQGKLQMAKEMCGYRPAGVWVDPDPAKRVFAIERPIWDIQVEKGNAVYTYVCSLAPDLVAKTCKVGQGGLEDYMERFKAVLATFASITCDPAATSYVPLNVLADGASFPLVEPGMATGGACLKMATNFISDVGCSLVDNIYDRFNKAVECCAGDCQTRAECALLSDGLVTRINIPSCGGDGEPATVLKMPTGFDLPATSGATCGGGDGKGYWGWGIWSG